MSVRFAIAEALERGPAARLSPPQLREVIARVDTFFLDYFTTGWPVETGLSASGWTLEGSGLSRAVVNRVSYARYVWQQVSRGGTGEEGSGLAFRLWDEILRGALNGAVARAVADIQDRAGATADRAGDLLRGRAQARGRSLRDVLNERAAEGRTVTRQAVGAIAPQPVAVAVPSASGLTGLVAVPAIVPVAERAALAAVVRGRWPAVPVIVIQMVGRGRVREAARELNRLGRPDVAQALIREAVNARGSV